MALKGVREPVQGVKGAKGPAKLRLPKVPRQPETQTSVALGEEYLRRRNRILAIEEKQAAMELAFARDELIEQLPPIITEGENWRVYEDGYWQLRNKDCFAQDALDIIPEGERKNRTASEILSHLGKRCQAREPVHWHNACRLERVTNVFGEESDNLVINVANGVVLILDNGALICLEPHNKDFYFTSRLAAAYDPKALAPYWLKALHANLPEASDRELLLLGAASIFIPNSRWETMFCLHGPTNTRKSTFAEGLECMAGPGACTSLSMAQICDPDDYSVPDLAGALLNISTELRPRDYLSDRLKQVVSGEPIHVRRIYGSPFQIRPSTKFFSLTNHLPRFKDATDAELRRLRFVSFNHVPVKKDLKLKDRIRKEGSGILNILLRKIQCLLTLTEFPPGSEQSQQTRERFEINNDPVGAFVKKFCALSPELDETPTTLIDAFKKWIENEGLAPETGNYFMKQLYSRFPVKRVRGTDDSGRRLWVVRGISLIDPEPAS
jgi:P4 family phage/plasmid primase-like protien